MNILTYPNEFLKKVVKDFDFENPVIPPYELEEQMVRLMIEANGIGLAATQVGVDARVFVIKIQNIPEIYTPFAMFNPELIGISEETEIRDEGCLSFPNLFFKVKRPQYIIVKFFDRDNKERIIELEGIDARCFLHELDHLNGICFTDNISELKLKMAIKKQRKNNGRTK